MSLLLTYQRRICPIQLHEYPSKIVFVTPHKYLVLTLRRRLSIHTASWYLRTEHFHQCIVDWVEYFERHRVAIDEVIYAAHANCYYFHPGLECFRRLVTRPAKENASKGGSVKGFGSTLRVYGASIVLMREPCANEPRSQVDPLDPSHTVHITLSKTLERVCSWCPVHLFAFLHMLAPPHRPTNPWIPVVATHPLEIPAWWVFSLLVVKGSNSLIFALGLWTVAFVWNIDIIRTHASRVQHPVLKREFLLELVQKVLRKLLM